MRPRKKALASPAFAQKLARCAILAAGALAAAPGLCCAWPSQATAAEPTLAELVARFAEHATALESLTVEFNRQPIPGGIHAESTYEVERWTWCRQGGKRLIVSEPIQLASLKFPLRHWEYSDGDKVIWLNHAAPELRQPLEQFQHDGRSKEVLVVFCAYFEWIAGNCINNMRQPLYRELRDGQARLVGRTTVQGVPCYQIESSEFPTLWPTSPHVVRVDLDPAADFYPRRIEVHPAAWWKHGDWQKYENGTDLKLEVVEYRTAWDPLAARERYFPGRMDCLQYFSRTELTAVSIRCNEPIPDEVFHPVLPEGVLVHEHYGTPRQSQFITGGEAGRLIYEESRSRHRQATAQVDDAPPAVAGVPVARPIDATPSTGGNYSAMAAGAGLVCLLAAVVTLICNRRRAG